MAINWFEGGRRIRNIIMGLVGAGGAFYLFYGGSNEYVTFETKTPDTPWVFTTQPCNYPDRDKTAEQSIFVKRKAERITLCFRTQADHIFYARAGFQAPAPVFNPVPVGQPVPPDSSRPKPQKVPLYYHADAYSPQVDSYMNERQNSFVVTPVMQRDAEEGFGSVKWIRGWARLEEAIPWVFGLWFGFWIITAGLGWIVRGFAGIPTGKDFKPDKT